MPQLHQAVGILKWQGLQQNCMHNAEYGRVRPDAKRHDQDGDRGESWAFEQVSSSEFQILDKSGQGAALLQVAGRLCKHGSNCFDS